MKCEKLTITNVSWQHMEDIRNYAILFTLTSFQFEAEKVFNDIEIFFINFELPLMNSYEVNLSLELQFSAVLKSFN